MLFDNLTFLQNNVYLENGSIMRSIRIVIYFMKKGATRKRVRKKCLLMIYLLKTYSLFYKLIYVVIQIIEHRTCLLRENIRNLFRWGFSISCRKRMIINGTTIVGNSLNILFIFRY